jgi:hypothetical protein
MKTNYFARVITDYVVFAYMMDVFITEEHVVKDILPF